MDRKILIIDSYKGLGLTGCQQLHLIFLAMEFALTAYEIHYMLCKAHLNDVKEKLIVTDFVSLAAACDNPLRYPVKLNVTKSKFTLHQYKLAIKQSSKRSTSKIQNNEKNTIHSNNANRLFSLQKRIR